MSYEECDRHGTDVTYDYCRMCEAELQLRTRAVLPDEIDEMPEEPAPIPADLYGDYPDFSAMLQRARAYCFVLEGSTEHGKAMIEYAFNAGVAHQESLRSKLWGDIETLARKALVAPGLTSRTVYPDEIEEDPVEPALDEGLVERVKSAAVRAISEGGSMVGASVPEAIARAVLAETTAWNAHIEEKRGQAFAKMSEDWEASQKRVAELEAELALNVEGKIEHMKAAGEANRELESVRMHRDKLTADLATVTRERDELASRHGVDCVNAQRRIDSLTRELAEAKALANKRGDMVCDYERLLRENKLETHALSGKLAEAKRHQDHVSKVSDARSRCLDRLTRELAEAKRDEHSACERGNRLAQELAEAREELRSAKSRMWELGHENDRMSGELAIHRVREVVLRGQYRGYVSDGDCAMLDALDAHRTKTSGAVVGSNEADESFCAGLLAGARETCSKALPKALAAEPEVNAVLPIDAEDERVVDALVHRKTAGRTETPLLGPHAGTVADHERRLQALEECWLRPAARANIIEEIRAERAGRVKP